jgi:hypothetical protein
LFAACEEETSVRELIRVQSADNRRTTNDHRISLKQSLVTPQRISVIARQVADGRLQDQTLNVWLVGQEDSSDGYKIIMLLSAFLSM